MDPRIHPIVSTGPASAGGIQAGGGPGAGLTPYLGTAASFTVWLV